MTGANRNQQLDAIWRAESPRLMARLARLCSGDVGLAEELAQDAFVKAIETWPSQGTPAQPGAWLFTTARNLAIDRARRGKSFEGKRDELGRDMQARGAFDAPDVDAQLDSEIEDDLLRLIFATCHPSLSHESQVALTLRMLGGLRTDEIARAFLTSESTIGQRISRAKKTLAAGKFPFEVPTGAELPARIQSVFEVVYLIFNEGYSATAGDDLLRKDLCQDAVRLGRLLVELAPDEPEVHGLQALMELQASRLDARTDDSGDPVLLPDQDRSRWDRDLIDSGLAELDRATALSPSAGRYTLQAQIAACHAQAANADATNWGQIAAIYAELAQLTPSPVIELNRAVAVSMADGPQAGLDLLESIADAKELANYHLLPAVRGDLLAKLGRTAEAQNEFRRAAELTRNEKERALLLGRAAAGGDD